MEDNEIARRQRSKQAIFTENIINEVKQRPVLWQRIPGQSKDWSRLALEWEEIAAKLNMKPRILKSKWRNIKDTFNREAKKTIIPSEDSDAPIEKYYTGSWAHFDKLTFLYDPTKHQNNNQEIYIQIGSPQMQSEDDSIEIAHKVEYQGEITNETYHSEVDPIEGEVDFSRKRLMNASEAQANKRRRYGNPCVVMEDSETDEDLHFMKSLVSFMKKLNPIRKLIVRNEMQNLLLKELMCDSCKSSNPRLKCHCNL